MEVTQDPIKRKKLYDYLSSEKMTPLDYDTFSKEYSTNDEKFNKLHGYLSEQGMTNLDKETFKQEYFGDLKKKESSNSTSQNQELVSEAKDTVGTSGTPQTEPNTIDLTDSEVKRGEKTVEQDIKLPKQKDIFTDEEFNTLLDKTSAEAAERERQERVKVFNNLDNYRERTDTNTEEVKQTIDQRVKDEETVGFWDGIKDGAITTLKRFAGMPSSSAKTKTEPFKEEKAEVKSQALKDGKELSEQEVELKAKELYRQKQEDFLYVDKANDYLEDITTEEKGKLQKLTGETISELSEDNQKIKKANALLQADIESEYQSLSAFKKELDEQPKEFTTQEEVDAFNAKIQDYQQRYESLEKKAQLMKRNEDRFLNNQEDLLTAKKELDMFKRNYQSSFRENLALTTSDLILGGVDFMNYASDLVTPDSPTYGNIPAVDTSQERAQNQYERENLLRKPVESVESVNGFFNYAGDLIANQLPILALTSTGYGGLAYLGASGTGQKYGEMVDEMNDSLAPANYTPWQMALVPFVHGSAEAVFELPTLAILNKGKRIISAGLKETPDLFKEPAKSVYREITKDYTNENLAEQGTNLIQNGLNIYALGKDGNILDGSLDVFKDTSLITLLMQGAPHIIQRALKPFHPQDKTEKLETNAYKMLGLAKELENQDLTPTEKTLIESEIQKISSESETLMQETIENVSTMPDELKQEISKINAELGEIREQAKEIETRGNSNNKEGLKKILGDKFKALQDKRESILKGETTIVDTLPLNEQNPLIRQALKELTEELNPEGKKDMTIDDAQITERANQIYLNNKNAKTETSATETEEQTMETSTPESEVSQTTNETVNEAPTVEPQTLVTPQKIQQKVEEIKKRKAITEQEAIKQATQELSEGRNGAIDPKEIKARANEIQNAESKGGISESQIYQQAINEIQQESQSNTTPTNQTTNKPSVNKNLVTKERIDTKVKEIKKRSEISEAQAYKQAFDELSKDNKGVLTADKINTRAKEIQKENSIKGKSESDIYKQALTEIQNEINLNNNVQEQNQDENVNEQNQVQAENLQEQEEVTNESQAQGNTTPNEDVQPSTEQNIREGKDNASQPTSKPRASETTTEVKVGAGTFEVTLNDAGVPTKAVSKKTGKEISKTSERVIKSGKDKGKISVEPNRQWVKISNKALGVKSESQLKEERKQKLSSALQNFEPATLFDKAVEFFARGGVLSNRDAQTETGYSQNELKWVSKDSRIRPESELDTVSDVADDLDPENSLEMLNALVLAMQKFQNREAAEDYVIEKYNTKEDSNNDNQSESYEDQREESYLRSLEPEERALYESNKADVIFDSNLTEEDQINYYQEQYEKQIESLSTEDQAKLYEQSERRLATKSDSDGQSNSKQKTTAEKKQVAFDKIDNLAQKLKDALPGITDGDITTNGFNQNQLIDLMAKSVKHLVGTGIEVNAAIQQVVKSIKDKLNIDINPDDVKAKYEESNKKQEPKKEPDNNFKRKSGKKSVLNRIVTGSASEKLAKALKKHGLDYEVESQDEAKKRAEAFVKDIGLDDAIDALKSGTIKAGAELAFIYSTVIDMMEMQADKATGKQKEKLEQDYAKLQEDIFVSLDAKAREFGRFLSALNKVYNSSYFKYNLAKQIEDYKARNNGEIDAETKKKFEERDAKLKEFEKKIKELEEKLAEAEAKEAVEDIDEFNQRQKPKNKPSKSSLKKAATALRKAKFTQSINDLSKLQSDPAGLIKGIWDGAIEVMATALDGGASIEVALRKGIASIKKTDWYKGLKKENKQIVEEKFKDDARGIIDSTTIEDDFMVTIDEDGKIKVPAKLIRQLVSEGFTDPDQLAQKVLDEYLADEDVTLREVRDAITGYGKTINPTQDELSEQVSITKNLGRVLSGMEDVIEKRQRPKKSGLQRRTKIDEERRKERALKEAMRDLPIDEKTSEKEWKTQLDAIKSRLNNQIRDLQDQIDKQERRKPERTPIEYDQEARDLKEQRDTLKETLDNLVGKPELSYEDKVRMIENALITSIENLEADIKNRNLAFKEKTSITSENIKALRERQKELREQLNEMRKQSGLIEKRRLEARKKAVQKRLEELQTKRKNKDYSKKERKPLPEDQELKELQREYNREKEKYDQEAYADELKNLPKWKKVINQIGNFLGLQRVLLATGEFSFVFLQNAVPTVNLMVKVPGQIIRRKPVTLFNVIAKTVKAYSNSKYEKDYAAMENGEFYDLALKSGVALTRTDYKMAAREENFQSDMITSMFKVLGDSMDFNGESKLTLYDTVLKKLGVNVKDKERFSVGEQVENSNPFAAMERFTATYGNHIKMDLFAKGVRKLQQENKNPIDHKKDYERLANAINTLTGRANLNLTIDGLPEIRLESSSQLLNMLFFSIRFATSTFNKLNPLWYGVMLRNSETPLTKPSVAQKMAISQVFTYISTTAGFILALQALGGEDDEGNKIVDIEKDSTSSDFGKLKIGNIRFDPWGGHMPWVTLISRISTGKMKKSNGKVVTLGEGSNDNRFEKIVDFGVGKLNPTLATGVRFLSSTPEIDGVRRDKYGNEVSVEEELKQMYPIYWQGIKEVIEEDPDKGKEIAFALTALGFLGVNNQVYGTGNKDRFRGYAKDTKNEMSVKRGQYLRANEEEITPTKELNQTFESFKELHEQSYKELFDRVRAESKKLKPFEIAKLLKAGGHSQDDIRDIMRGKVPDMIEIQESTLKRKLEYIESRATKKDEDKLETMLRDVENKAEHYNKMARRYNRTYRPIK